MSVIHQLQVQEWKEKSLNHHLGINVNIQQIIGI